MSVSPAALLGVLSRMNPDNHSVTLWNASREFKVRLRVSSEPSEDEYDFEFGIVVSDEEEDDDYETLMSRVLRLEHDGFWDEDLFVIKDYTKSKEECAADHSVLSHAAAKLTQVLHWEVCNCNQNFIKDGLDECLACSLTAPPDDPTRSCGVCHEEGPDRQMTKQPCCAQYLHKKCLARCVARCPFCRCSTCEMDA